MKKRQRALPITVKEIQIMRALTAPLHELLEFEEVRSLLKKPGKAAALTGCVESQKLHMVYGLSDGFK